MKADLRLGRWLAAAFVATALLALGLMRMFQPTPPDGEEPEPPRVEAEAADQEPVPERATEDADPPARESEDARQGATEPPAEEADPQEPEATPDEAEVADQEATEPSPEEADVPEAEPAPPADEPEVADQEATEPPPEEAEVPEPAPVAPADEPEPADQEATEPPPEEAEVPEPAPAAPVDEPGEDPDESESTSDWPPPWLLALVAVLVLAVALLGWIVWRRIRASNAVRAAARAPAFGIRYAHGQAQGGRKRQEDDFGRVTGDSLDPEGRHTVLVVADGMGGHAAGDVASRIGVRGFVENYGDRGPVRDRLQGALDQANAAIAEDLDRNRAHAGMGTTIVATAITSDGLEWISVGDSALYLYRDGRIERLNDDHSMRPVIARWEKEDPVFASTLNPNELRSVVMGRRIPQTDLSEEPRKLRAGDIVVLATDGLETLSEKEVARVIADHRDGGPPGIRRALLEALEAKQHPHQDNTTLYIAEIEADSAGTSSREPDLALEADTEPPDRVPTGIGSADKDVTR